MEAFLLARDARARILERMLTAIDKPRAEVSRHAPRLLILKIPVDKIGSIIGPGGRIIKKMQEETGASIDIADDGTINVASKTAEGAEKARDLILGLTAEAVVGRTYLGRVTGVKEFGAFVEILPGRDGLCHISELSDSYVAKVEDVCKLRDEMLVKVLSIDDQGKIRLSRKAALKEKQQKIEGEVRGNGDCEIARLPNCRDLAGRSRETCQFSISAISRIRPIRQLLRAHGHGFEPETGRRGARAGAPRRSARLRRHARRRPDPRDQEPAHQPEHEPPIARGGLAPPEDARGAPRAQAHPDAPRGDQPPQRHPRRVPRLHPRAPAAARRLRREPPRRERGDLRHAGDGGARHPAPHQPRPAPDDARGREPHQAGAPQPAAQRRAGDAGRAARARSS